MIRVIDCFDSFTYILTDYLKQLYPEVEVSSIDEPNLLYQLQIQPPSGLVLSPGPGIPDDYPLLSQLISWAQPTIPILGICLGHQAVGEYYGWKLVKNKAPKHGKQSEIRTDQSKMFKGIPAQIKVCRYHSLSLQPAPNTPLIAHATANDDGAIMAISHKKLPIWGIQYHPEAILTEQGISVLNNWVNVVSLQTSLEPLA